MRPERPIFTKKPPSVRRRQLSWHAQAGVVLFGMMLCVQPAMAAGSEKRCGWYVNATPGNIELRDRDGAWSISSQMEANGPDARGLDRLGALDNAERVSTQPNGYGYSCACLVVESRQEEMRIVRIVSAQPMALDRCKSDASLPSPE